MRAQFDLAIAHYEIGDIEIAGKIGEEALAALTELPGSNRLLEPPQNLDVEKGVKLQPEKPNAPRSVTAVPSVVLKASPVEPHDDGKAKSVVDVAGRSQDISAPDGIGGSAGEASDTQLTSREWFLQ